VDDSSSGSFLDRRFTKRHNLETPLRVRVWKSDVPERRAESLNLSQRGIFFATNLSLDKGEIVEILLKMPEEITGEPPTEWRCTGHVVRVEPVDSSKGKLGVGVHFDCYEVARAKPLQPPLTTRLPRGNADTPRVVIPSHEEWRHAMKIDAADEAPHEAVGNARHRRSDTKERLYGKKSPHRGRRARHLPAY